MAERCPDDSQVLAFVERRLSGRARAAMDAHLDRCGDCRRLVARLICAATDRPPPPDSVRPPPSTAGETAAKSRLAELLATLTRDAELTPLPDKVADRFAILGVAGRGGMGIVFRARDEHTGGEVALKVLGSRSIKPVRFRREAEALARLEHPAVVRYIDHGNADGLDYLAMEWLEGETLRARLTREPLSVDDALTLGARVAEGIAEAHRLGLIHRDLKPSNLMLANGEVAQTKVIDFGLTRRAGFPTHWTGTNVVGTPGYLAPEQARGEAVDERADLFALGAILHEAIAGGPAFAARDKTALLAKVLLEPVPSLERLRPDVPIELAELVSSLLHKDPAQRPASALAVADKLGRLQRSVEDGVARSTKALTRGERELIIVLVVGRDAGEEVHDESLPGGGKLRRKPWLARLADHNDARYEPLATGPSLLSWKAEDAPDCARRAVAVALDIGRRAPGLPMGIATVRAEVGKALAAGEAIDRAVSLVHQRPRRGAAALDGLTADLVAGHFDVSSDEQGRAWLRGSAPEDEPRMVAGRPTPLVGRETELAMALAAVTTSFDASEARAIVLMGDAGMGKTRLRHEIIAEVAVRFAPLHIWTAAADPMEAEVAGALVGRLISRAAHVDEHSAPAARQARLKEFVRATVAEPDATRVGDFVVEMAGLSRSGGEPGEALRAAMQSVAVMREQRRRALSDLVKGALSRRPLVIVLEDLQWADAASLELMEHVLMELCDRPLLVLATARPTLEARGPLWPRAETQVIRVGRIRQAAARRLVDAVLAGEVGHEDRARIVDRAEGHPLSLEELIRAAAAGALDLTPRTVLALFQSRLARMELAARRILRAASFFGVSFTSDGVSALLGGDPPDDELLRWLDTLVAREVLVHDGRTYRFRHALYREAADATLTDQDRETGHRLVGRWFAEHRAAEPAVIAEHLQRGDRAAEAARWYVRAAEQALGAHDFDGTLSFAARAISCGARGELLGEVRALEAEAYQWRGEDERMDAAASEALERLPPEHPRYGPAAGLGALSAFRRGRPERTIAIAEQLLSHLRAAPEITYPAALAGIYCAEHVHLTGRLDLGAALLSLVEERASDLVARDPLIVAARAKARARAAAHAADAAASARYYAQAAEAYQRIGDRRLAGTMLGAHGCMLSELGDFEQAARDLELALCETRALGLTAITSAFEHNLAIAYARAGRLDEADQHQRAALEQFEAQGFERMIAGCHIWLALTALERGEHERAARHAEVAVAQQKAGEPVRAYSLATRARVALAAGRVDDALGSAGEAMAILRRIGHLDEGESLARLIYAEALAAAGQSGAAREAIAEAERELMARAQRITDPALRQRFLERVSENAATLALARALGAEGAQVEPQ